MRPILARVVSFTLATLAAACSDPGSPTTISPSSDPLRAVNNHAVDAGHHFGRFVAIGTSQTAAVMSGGLFAGSQQQAWPAQLARLANVEFTMPLLTEWGCPAPLRAPLELQLRVNGDLQSIASCSPLMPHVVLPTQNLAIPNALTSDALSTTPEMAAAINPGVGPLYSRILPPGQTQVSAMRAQDPSFVAVEFGGVEVIRNTRLGVTAPVVPFAQWAASYDAVIAEVTAEGARAVLVSFPGDMALWPGLRTGAELHAERAAFAARHISVTEACGAAESQNLVYLPRKVLRVLSAASAAKTAGLPPIALTCTDVPGTLDAVLTPTEAIAVNAAWTQVNDYIIATAAANGFAHFSLNDLFTLPDFRPPFSLEALLTSGEPFGPYMSLDDLHPNARGERVLAEAAAKALNATYALHIPWQRRLIDR